MPADEERTELVDDAGDRERLVKMMAGWRHHDD